MLKKYTKPYPTIGNIIAGKNLITFLIADMMRNVTPRRRCLTGQLKASFAAALR